MLRRLARNVPRLIATSAKGNAGVLPFAARPRGPGNLLSIDPLNNDIAAVTGVINVRSLKRLERTASQPSSRRLIPLEEIEITKLHFSRFFVRVPFVYLLVRLCLSP